MRHVVYIGIAAGALLFGAGAWAWRKFHSHCPTRAEMAAILLEIDTGRTGRSEAEAMAVRFESQGCIEAATAVRNLLAKKPVGTAMSSGVAAADLWPATDPKCAKAINALPRESRPNPTGGSRLPSFYELAMRAASGTDTRVLRDVADILDSAGLGASAAACLRGRADSLTTPSIAKAGLPTAERKAAAPMLMATLGHRSVPSRFAAVVRGRGPQPPKPRST